MTALYRPLPRMISACHKPFPFIYQASATRRHLSSLCHTPIPPPYVQRSTLMRCLPLTARASRSSLAPSAANHAMCLTLPRVSALFVRHPVIVLSRYTLPTLWLTAHLPSVTPMRMRSLMISALLYPVPELESHERSRGISVQGVDDA